MERNGAKGQRKKKRGEGGGEVGEVGGGEVGEVGEVEGGG